MGRGGGGKEGGLCRVSCTQPGRKQQKRKCKRRKLNCTENSERGRRGGRDKCFTLSKAKVEGLESNPSKKYQNNATGREGGGKEGGDWEGKKEQRAVFDPHADFPQKSRFLKQIPSRSRRRVCLNVGVARRRIRWRGCLVQLPRCLGLWPRRIKRYWALRANKRLAQEISERPLLLNRELFSFSTKIRELLYSSIQMRSLLCFLKNNKLSSAGNKRVTVFFNGEKYNSSIILQPDLKVGLYILFRQ